MLNLYHLELDSSTFNSTAKKLLHYVSDARKEKILRYKFDKDRLLSLYGILLISFALDDSFDVNIIPLELQTTHYGKPYLEYLDYCKFNLSHTKGYVTCCTSSVSDVGVDVENLLLLMVL